MADCCTTDSTPANRCPECGQLGPVVGAAPVRTHRPEVGDGPWQYCPTLGCAVVFHLDVATVTEGELRSRVGAKAVAAAEPVCFCFGHTRSDLADDLARHDGATTIKPAIKAAVADGLCACEHLNPDGSCCLAAVHRTMKAIQSETVAVR